MYGTQYSDRHLHGEIIHCFRLTEELSSNKSLKDTTSQSVDYNKVFNVAFNTKQLLTSSGQATVDQLVKRTEDAVLGTKQQERMKTTPLGNAFKWMAEGEWA